MYAVLEHPTKYPVYCRKILVGKKKQKRARAYKGIELQTLYVFSTSFHFPVQDTHENGT